MVLGGNWLANECSGSLQDWVPLDGSSVGWDSAGRSPEVMVPHTEETGLCYTCKEGEAWSRTGREKGPWWLEKPLLPFTKA